MSEILIYQNESGNIKVDVIFEDDSIWLSQAQICEVFGKAKSTISEHIKAIFEEEELNPISTVRNYRTVQKEGNREVARVEKYNKQYSNIELKNLTKFHDRFLIIDNNELYHIGASLKDLGNKTFAFSKLNIDLVEFLGKLK